MCLGHRNCNEKRSKIKFFISIQQTFNWMALSEGIKRTLDTVMCSTLQTCSRQCMTFISDMISPTFFWTFTAWSLNFFSFFLYALMACSAFVTLANTWSVQIPLYLLSPDPWICEPNPKMRFRSIVYSGILVSFFLVSPRIFSLHSNYMPLSEYNR